VKPWRLYLLIGTVAVLFSLVGCGRRGDEQTGGREEKSITIAVYAGGREGAIEGPLWHWKEEWEKGSGYVLNIVPIPYAQLRERILTDLKTGMGQYDGFIVPGYYYGDLIEQGYIVPIDQFMESKDHPQWDPDTIVPVLKPLHQWEDHWYGVPNDGDAQVLYYREDILTDPKWQEAYRRETGSDLPVPPQTWDELLKVARFFTGKDLNGDGQGDYGISLELKPNDQSFNHFLAVTAPYVVNPGERVDRYHNVYWFDPETMEPLVDSPGHEAGLRILVELSKCAPEAALSFGLEDTWNLFLNGQAVFCPTFGDLGALAQDANKSRVRGKVGCAIMPGSRRLWDREKRRWVSLPRPNLVANTIGCSWHGLISKFSEHPEVVYDLFAFHAQRRVHTFNTVYGWTGVDPGRSFDFLPPHGDARLQDYLDAGWDPHDIQQYLNAYYQNYYEGDTYLTFLRIPNTEDFFNVLDRYMLQAVGGQITPKQALQSIKAGWQRIIDREGKDRLLRLYQASIGYSP